MKRACIAIVDAVRARIYTYDQDSEPQRQLLEVTDLVNPARRQRPSQLFSDTRPGSDKGPGERGFAFDDHRDAHIEEMDSQFAKAIVGELDRVVREGAYGELIVLASPNMLGELRKNDGVLHRDGLHLEEVPRDLAKLTSSQLHDHLAQMHLLPPRERPGARSAAR